MDGKKLEVEWSRPKQRGVPPMGRGRGGPMVPPPYAYAPAVPAYGGYNPYNYNYQQYAPQIYPTPQAYAPPAASQAYAPPTASQAYAPTPPTYTAPSTTTRYFSSY